MTSSGLDNSGLSSLQQDQYSNASKLDARIALHARFSERNDWYDWLFEHYRVPDTGRILELGCGSGQLWRHLGERIPDGWQIMLTDLSPGMIGTARENLAGLRRDFRFQVVDAQAIPFGDATFDAVIANHMLYHVPDRDTAFAEIRRVLRTRGQLYAGTNGAGHLQELSAVLEQLGVQDVFAMAAYSFSVESGAAQLSEWFEWVTLDTYEDCLNVTEVEPLVAYVQSMAPRLELGDRPIAAFRSWAQSELDRSGGIKITKSSGLFTAS